MFILLNAKNKFISYIYITYLYLKLYDFFNTRENINTMHTWPIIIAIVSYGYNLP